MKRRTANKVEARDRITISLEPETRRMGQELARQDGRDFSHQVEALIRAEVARKESLVGQIVSK